MKKIRLGRTGLMVSASGFGAIPIQRITVAESTKLLRKAFDAGINFYDTARAYTDSEERIGTALSDVRKDIIIATKSGGDTYDEVLNHLDTSLRLLKTDYIDIYQLHNPAFVPRPGDEKRLYEAMLDAKKAGKIRFIGITNHRSTLAKEAVESGLYDTLQFPLSCISADEDFALADLCKQADVGFIAMKALAGGLLNDARAAFAGIRCFENVVPIWGIQFERELDEFLAFEKQPPLLDEKMQEIIAKYREELSGLFCRGCGYCMPCPVDIPISMAARMSFLMTRSSPMQFLTAEWVENMGRIPSCQACGQCRNKCPYGLNTPEILKEEYAKYQAFREAHG